MDLQKGSGEDFMLILNSRELELVLSCLRESFALIGRKEYLLRAGVPIEEALMITMELRAVMEREGLGL